MLRRALAFLVAIGAAAAMATPSGAYQRPGRTEMVSVTAKGVQGNDLSAAYDRPVITPDARYVAFSSIASNLVANDVNHTYDVFRKDLVTGALEIVSAGLNGLPAIGDCLPGAIFWGSQGASISDNGRFISFSSCATNLVAGDTNLTRDVFIRDMTTNTTTRVSVSSTGDQALPLTNTVAGAHALSADGRRIAFQSFADNLVPHDTNQDWDVFVHDRVARTTKRVSVSSSEKEADDGSFVCDSSALGQVAITANGRYVAFPSYAGNLDVRDTDTAGVDIFVRDMKRGTTEQVNFAFTGEQAQTTRQPYPDGCPAENTYPTISSNGRYVAYASWAYNAVPNDDTTRRSIYVYDRVARRTDKVDVKSSGEMGTNTPVTAAWGEFTKSGGSWEASISRDGRFIALHSVMQLTPENGEGQIYLHDRLTGTTELISKAADGTAAGGRWEYLVNGRTVVFGSDSPSITTHDGNGKSTDAFLRHRGVSLGTSAQLRSVTLAAAPQFARNGIATKHDPRGDAPAEADIRSVRLVHRPRLDDLYMRIDLESMDLTGTIPGHGYRARLTTTGGVFEVRAHAPVSLLGLTAAPAPLQLFGCTATCEFIQNLHGGVGTVGQAVTSSIPRSAVGLADGGTIEAVEAFTTDVASGPLDSLRLTSHGTGH